MYKLISSYNVFAREDLSKIYSCECSVCYAYNMKAQAFCVGNLLKKTATILHVGTSIIKKKVMKRGGDWGHLPL